MKKYAILLPLMVVMLFALTACNGNDIQEINTTTNNAQANAPTATTHPDIYLFHESTNMGVYFSIHPAWYGLFGTIESLAEHDEGNTSTLVVYHIATRNEFGMGESGGVLFWINRSPHGLFAEVSEGFTGVILAQRAGYVYTLNYPRGFEYLYDSDSVATAQYLDMMGYLQPWDDNFVTNSFRLVGADPFADALLEFFEGGAETPVGVDATKAFWHTIGDIPIMVAMDIRLKELGLVH